MMKKYILLFFCYFPAIALAGTTFNELFDIELNQYNQLADRVAVYHTIDIAMDIRSQQTELELLQNNIDNILKVSPDEPVYWFINGLNHNNLAALFTALNNQDAVNRQIELRNTAYQKAMRLDQIPPLKLSAAIYATMKHGLPDAEKIKAIENEIKKGGSGDSDDQYIQLHWSLVNALEKTGRHNEAQNALAEMQREIKRLELKSPDYDLIVHRAQSEIDQGRTAAISQSAPQQNETQNTKPVSIPSKPINKKILWVIFFGFLALISIWIIVRAWRSK
jgi:hypothetical protein